MPGAPIAEGLGGFPNLGSPFLIRAETHRAGRYAELVGFKLVGRVLDEKFLSSENRAFNFFPFPIRDAVGGVAG
jgi:hypothetical protein